MSTHIDERFNTEYQFGNFICIFLYTNECIYMHKYVSIYSYIFILLYSNKRIQKFPNIDTDALFGAEYEFDEYYDDDEDVIDRESVAENYTCLFNRNECKYTNRTYENINRRSSVVNNVNIMNKINDDNEFYNEISCLRRGYTPKPCNNDNNNNNSNSYNNVNYNHNNSNNCNLNNTKNVENANDNDSWGQYSYGESY
jgi:hypothetical protein